MWAKVFEENRDLKGYEGAFEEHGGACTVNALLDEENTQILIDAGSQTARNAKSKGPNEEGLYDVKLKRKWEAPYTYGGAPRVVHVDGKTNWDPHEDGLIGNMSECVFYASVYTAKGLKGTRLDALQVLDLVEFDGELGGSGPQIKDYSKPTPDSTKPKTKPKAKAKVEVNDDEIPF